MKLPSIDSEIIRQYAKHAKAYGTSLLHIQNKPLIKDLQNLRYAPLTEDVVKLSEKAKFEKSLNSTHIAKPIKVSLGGKESEWLMYRGSQMGSQDAFWAKNNATGDLFYVKFAQEAKKEGHIESEIMASKLYNLAGIDTPELMPVTIDGKIKGLASKFIEGSDNGTAQQLQKGFAADAWLANWDSLLEGNTFVHEGKLFKVDNGGALKYRAMGELKPNFGDTVDELVTLVDGRNWESTRVYSEMTHGELVKSFEGVCGISDKAIRETVSDKNLAQTLINRRNYMRDVLAEMKAHPRTDESLDVYFSKIAGKIAEKRVFHPELVSKTLSDKIAENSSEWGMSLDMPSTKSVSKFLIEELKSMEKKGVKISKDDILKLFSDIADEGLELKKPKYNGNFRGFCDMEELYHRLFVNLSNLAEKTPVKEGESMSSFVTRIVKLRERRIKQMDDYRIKSIKSKLKYEPDVSVPSRKLTESERSAAIAELEAHRKIDEYAEIYLLPKLKETATDKQIYRAWQAMHMGGGEFKDKELSKAVMELGGRYNSKHPIKTKERFDVIAEKDYKSEFEIEPVYHWFGRNNPDKFVKTEIPKVGEIYTVPSRQCCSTHRDYAEGDFGDSVSTCNIKFILHPKSETSRAYNVGLNQEVVYAEGEQFRILDKECIECINPKTGKGYSRWEIHMQEV